MFNFHFFAIFPPLIFRLSKKNAPHIGLEELCGAGDAPLGKGSGREKFSYSSQFSVHSAQLEFPLTC